MESNAKEKTYYLIILILSVAILILSFISSINRIHLFNDPNKVYITYDLDAPYHVLLVMNAFDQTDAAIHKFLPIVTLGTQIDKNIKWAHTAPDKHGNYYYTSFPPLGFILPYISFKIFHVKFSLVNLMSFNLILKTVYILLIFYFFQLFLQNIVREKLKKTTLSTTAVLLTGTNFESMYSFSISYWAHQLFQVLLITNLLFLLHLLRSHRHKTIYAGFFISLFAMSYTEWSAFPYEACLLALLGYLYYKKRDKSYVTIGAISIFASAIPLILNTVLFSVNIGFHEYINLLYARQQFRSVAKIIEIINAYWISYFYLLILALISLALICYNKTLRKLYLPFTTFLLMFCIIENYIMQEHVILYSFDRLKIQIGLIFAVLIILVYYKNLAKIFMGTAAIFGVLSILQYDNIPPQQILGAENNPYIVNNFLANKLITINSPNRGYTELLFHHNVFEQTTIEDYLLHPYDRYYIYFDHVQWSIGRITEIVKKERNSIKLIAFYTENGYLLMPENFIEPLHLNIGKHLIVNNQNVRISEIKKLSLQGNEFYIKENQTPSRSTYNYGIKFDHDIGDISIQKPAIINISD